MIFFETNTLLDYEGIMIMRINKGAEKTSDRRCSNGLQKQVFEETQVHTILRLFLEKQHQEFSVFPVSD